MGNCQAVDAAALVIQHPNGRIQRMYWSITASEVMKINPGHYVSSIIPLPSPDAQVRFTRVKLLRPTDTLVLGRAYRLLTTHEVMKVVRAKKHAKMNNKPQPQPPEDNQTSTSDQVEVEGDGVHDERMFRQRSSSSILAASRSKSWRPSLQSISEATS